MLRSSLEGVAPWFSTFGKNNDVQSLSSTLFALGTELASEKPDATALQGSDAAGTQGPRKEASIAVILVTGVHTCLIQGSSLCKLIWL